MASVGVAPQTLQMTHHFRRQPARTAAAVGSALTGPTADRPLLLRLLGYAAWNCSASVEPDRATVSAFGEIAEVTRSKYPVPTSRWWRVAV